MRNPIIILALALCLRAGALEVASLSETREHLEVRANASTLYPPTAAELARNQQQQALQQQRNRKRVALATQRDMQVELAPQRAAERALNATVQQNRDNQAQQAHDARQAELDAKHQAEFEAAERLNHEAKARQAEARIRSYTRPSANKSAVVEEDAPVNATLDASDRPYGCGSSVCEESLDLGESKTEPDLVELSSSAFHEMVNDESLKHRQDVEHAQLVEEQERVKYQQRMRLEELKQQNKARMDTLKNEEDQRKLESIKQQNKLRKLAVKAHNAERAAQDKVHHAQELQQKKDTVTARKEENMREKLEHEQEVKRMRLVQAQNWETQHLGHIFSGNKGVDDVLTHDQARAALRARDEVHQNV